MLPSAAAQGSAALAQIDWAAPWLRDLRRQGEPLAQRIVAGADLHNTLNTPPTPPVRFVPQSELPSGVAYEQHIFATGAVPTRAGLHDFFNALCWMHFPRTKTRLNQLQAEQIACLGIRPERGPARDALTIFDENAAFLVAPDALWCVLLAKDWRRLFGELRPLWAQAQLLLFGHALLEKLVYPRKPITAHVYRAYPATHLIANPVPVPDVDAWMACDLSAEKLASKPFAHLPVLGVPGWWLANAEPGFYADASVFRPARS